MTQGAGHGQDGDHDSSSAQRPADIVMLLMSRTAVNDVPSLDWNARSLEEAAVSLAGNPEMASSLYI